MKKILYFFMMIFGFNVWGEQPNRLMPFITDGCSAGLNIPTSKNTDLVNCCVAHDFSYWQGGTKDDKKYADQKLEQCLKTIGISKITSKLFYWAVRSGGSAYFHTRWRWGYGWKYQRGYEVLSYQELYQVKLYEALIHLPINIAIYPLTDNILNFLSYNNFCLEDISKELASKTTLENPQKESLYFVRVKAKGTDAYQIFSDECKGGYFFVDFFPTTSSTRCFMGNYTQHKQLRHLQMYGECKEFGY